MSLEKVLRSLEAKRLDRRGLFRFSGLASGAMLAYYAEQRFHGLQIAVDALDQWVQGDDGGGYRAPVELQATQERLTTPKATRLVIPEIAKDEWIHQRIPGIAVDGQPKDYFLKPTWSGDTYLNVVRNIATTDPIVALTIDDAFIYRNEILDILKSRGVRATLFPKGTVAASDPAWVKRALAEGHEFGNHTRDHRDLITSQREGSLAYQLGWTQDALTSIAKEASTKPFLRPPGGSYDSFTVRDAATLGYRTIHWSFSTGDTGSDQSTPISTQLVRNSAKAGSVMLTHFTTPTYRGLAAAIDGLAQSGLRFTTLSEAFNRSS